MRCSEISHWDARSRRCRRQPSRRRSMRCWPVVTSGWVTVVRSRTSPAGWRIGSTRKRASVSTGYAAATPRKKKRAARGGPLICRDLAVRDARAEAIERRRGRVVVGDVGAVTQAIPDRGSPDDARRPYLADDHDSLPRRQYAQCAITRSRTRALSKEISGAKGVADRLRWRRRRIGDRLHGRARFKVNIAVRPYRSLTVPQILRPVVLFDRRVPRPIDGHHIRDVSAGPGSVLPTVPDRHGTDARSAVDPITDGSRGRIPAAAVAEEGRLPARACQRRAVEDDPLLAESECRERRAVSGIEPPGIQPVGRPAIRVVVDPGGAHRDRRDAKQ